MRLILAMTALAGYLLFSSGIAQAQSPADPITVVEETAQNILHEVSQRREVFTEQPELLAEVVRERLLPVFDLQYAARLILGRHGRGLAKEKVTEFSDAMSHLLIDRYAQGILEFRTSEQLEVLPLKGRNDDRLTRVRTRIKLDNGRFAPVDYAFRNTPDGWKAFDVTVEGISYVTTYRNQIGPQVQAEGLDTVIHKLRSGQVELQD